MIRPLHNDATDAEVDQHKKYITRLQKALQAAADDFSLIQQRIDDNQVRRAKETAWMGEREAKAAAESSSSEQKMESRPDKITEINALREEIDRLKDLINRNWSGAYWRAVNYQQAKEVNDAIARVPCVSDFGRLRDAAEGVISSASDTYKKRNGHLGSFEDESGEKCWIVPFDAFEDLRSAISSTTSKMEVVGHQAVSRPTMDDILSEQAAVNVLRPARYEARGTVVHKLPVKVPTEGGTSIEIGFPVCTASEYVDAETLAAMLDKSERTALAPTNQMISDSDSTLFKEATPDGGVIRLAKWPEGYVLWFHGEIVWRTWFAAAPLFEEGSLS